MNQKLEQDLQWFCRVYQNNAAEILHQQLPPAVAAAIERKLGEEFDLFKVSLFNRLAEEQ